MVVEVAEGFEIERIVSLSEQVGQKVEDPVPILIEVPLIKYRVDCLAREGIVLARVPKRRKCRLDHGFGIMSAVMQKAGGERMAR